MATLSAGNKSYAHNSGSQVPNPTTGFCRKPSGISETCIHVASLVEKRSLPHATDCVQSRMLQNARTSWAKLHVKQTEWLHSLLFFRLDIWTNAHGICIKHISALTKQCKENNWVKGACPVAKVRSIPSTYHDFVTASKCRHCDEANIMCRCSVYSKP